jgi:hypothetical protein
VGTLKVLTVSVLGFRRRYWKHTECMFETETVLVIGVDVNG